jgi:hypothetical protein
MIIGEHIGLKISNIFHYDKWSKIYDNISNKTDYEIITITVDEIYSLLLDQIDLEIANKIEEIYEDR